MHHGVRLIVLSWSKSEGSLSPGLQKPIRGFVLLWWTAADFLNADRSPCCFLLRLGCLRAEVCWIMAGAVAVLTVLSCRGLAICSSVSEADHLRTSCAVPEIQPVLHHVVLACPCIDAGCAMASRAAGQLDRGVSRCVR